MYILKKDIIPGSVIWGERNIYYDQPNKVLWGKKSMYVVTMVNDKYFLGCPLTVNQSGANCTILSKNRYPIRADSRITECLYKLAYSDIVSPLIFQISPGTFKHFRRNLYKRIALGKADSPDEYNEMFVQEYLKDNIPKVDDIIVYPSEEKEFKHYYIYNETEDSYEVVSVNQNKDNGIYTYSLSGKILINIPKSVRFFDYVTDHSLERQAVEDAVEGRSFQKSIGCYPKK